MVVLEAELGGTAIFPCNGSAYLGEEREEEEEEDGDEGPLFAWETLGGDVAVFHAAGGLAQASRYQVLLAFSFCS